MDTNKNPLPDRMIGYYDIAKGVMDLAVDEAKLFIKNVFRMPRQLASHGDHEFERPLDTPVEPVTMLYHDPTTIGWDSLGDYHDRENL